MSLVKNKYLQLFSAFILYSFIGVMGKMSSMRGFGIEFLILVGLQLFFLAIYALMWQQILKKFSLVTAMACKGVVVILNLAWAVIIVNENISLSNLVGSTIIVLGIIIISTEEGRDDQ